MTEFEDIRTSWRWFNGQYEDKISLYQQDRENIDRMIPAFQIKLLLEILKELQHLNDIIPNLVMGKTHNK